MGPWYYLHTLHAIMPMPLEEWKNSIGAMASLIYNDNMNYEDKAEKWETLRGPIIRMMHSHEAKVSEKLKGEEALASLGDPIDEEQGGIRGVLDSIVIPEKKKKLLVGREYEDAEIEWQVLNNVWHETNSPLLYLKPYLSVNYAPYPSEENSVDISEEQEKEKEMKSDELIKQILLATHGTIPKYAMFEHKNQQSRVPINSQTLLYIYCAFHLASEPCISRIKSSNSTGEEIDKCLHELLSGHSSLREIADRNNDLRNVVKLFSLTVSREIHPSAVSRYLAGKEGETGTKSSDRTFHIIMRRCLRIMEWYTLVKIVRHDYGDPLTDILLIEPDLFIDHLAKIGAIYGAFYLDLMQYVRKSGPETSSSIFVPLSVVVYMVHKADFSAPPYELVPLSFTDTFMILSGQRDRFIFEELHDNSKNSDWGKLAGNVISMALAEDASLERIAAL